jgi:hypothetical protein
MQMLQKRTLANLISVVGFEFGESQMLKFMGNCKQSNHRTGKRLRAAPRLRLWVNSHRLKQHRNPVARPSMSEARFSTRNTHFESILCPFLRNRSQENVAKLKLQIVIKGLF